MSSLMALLAIIASVALLGPLSKLVAERLPAARATHMAAGGVGLILLGWLALWPALPVALNPLGPETPLFALAASRSGSWQLGGALLLLAAAGLTRLLSGLFLKVVLADNLAPLVDTGFDQPLTALSALDVWTLAFLFGFQIYFDFSGYSHIALGCARMMGIRFPENFDFPYLASSPRDFWRRWHISLSSWIRDYLYIPLGGNRVGKWRATGNLHGVVQRARQQRPGDPARARRWSGQLGGTSGSTAIPPAVPVCSGCHCRTPSNSTASDRHAARLRARASTRLPRSSCL